MGLAVIGTALVLSGCFDSERRTEEGGEDNTPPPTSVNRTPTITGAPPANILEGELYEFVPNATDPDGDPLEFTITRKPAWATFDRATGRLSGTPDAADVGNFTNIGIAVSDGQASAALSGFDITVHQITEGSVTLSWNPPTENSDGTALTNLAGYRIYYGRNKDNLTQSVALNNAGVTRYVVENLSPARWHFAMTSLNTVGTESRRSPTVSKTIG